MTNNKSILRNWSKLYTEEKNEYFALDVDKMLDKISRYSKIDDIYTKIGLLCSKMSF